MTVPAADALRYDGTSRVPLVGDLAAADLLDAIDALHQNVPDGGILVCKACALIAPCPTARLLHPAPKEDK